MPFVWSSSVESKSSSAIPAANNSGMGDAGLGGGGGRGSAIENGLGAVGSTGGRKKVNMGMSLSTRKSWRELTNR